MIEQAIYASARSGQRDGYQVVAASGGIPPDDLRELSLWCPSHDGLLDASGNTPSLNAFPLASGAYCIARSFAAAPEYSARGGQHVVTHALFFAAEDYRRFANNPFAAMQAALAAGHAAGETPRIGNLPVFDLVGRARVVDRTVIRQALTKHSLSGLLLALDTCLEPETAVLAVHEGGPQLLAALVTCLPLGLRCRISLATGLVYSSRRSYQWLIQNGSGPELHRLARLPEIRVAHVALPRLANVDAPEDGKRHAWTRCVEECLLAGEYVGLERYLQEAASLEDIAALDDFACESLTKSELGVSAVP